MLFAVGGLAHDAINSVWLGRPSLVGKARLALDKNEVIARKIGEGSTGELT